MIIAEHLNIVGGGLLEAVLVGFEQAKCPGGIEKQQDVE